MEEVVRAPSSVPSSHEFKAELVLPYHEDNEWLSEPDVDEFIIARNMLKTRPAEALARLESLASSSSRMSMVEIGWAYGLGRGVQYSLKDAEKWLRKAVTAGSISASFYLAYLYRDTGQFEKAVNSYKIGAKVDYSPSLYWLGVMCCNGQGCPKDEKLAMIFFERASKLGHGFARRNAALLRIRSQSGILDVVSGALSWIGSIFYIISLALKNAKSHNLK